MLTGHGWVLEIKTFMTRLSHAQSSARHFHQRKLFRRIRNTLEQLSVLTPPPRVLLTSNTIEHTPAYQSTVSMSSNVGLTTPRGSGTSGYVQRNLSNLKPRDTAQPYPKDFDSIKHRQRQPDKDILEHDRKRQIEVKVFELRDQLEDEG